MTHVQQIDAAGRWWQVGQHELDLNAEPGAYSWQARACALAHRDGTDDEGQEVAFLAECLVDGTVTDAGAERAVTQWLFDQSQAVVARAWQRIRALDGGSNVRAA